MHGSKEPVMLEKYLNERTSLYKDFYEISSRKNGQVFALHSFDH